MRSPQPSVQHLDPETLRRFLAERLDEAEEVRVQEHLDDCEECRAALESVAGKPKLWADLQEHLVDADIESAPAELAGDGEAADDLTELQALLDPTDDPRMMGRLGGYEVCGLIGRGTTGIVVKALEPRLNRYVAIKLMSPGYRANGSALRRFEREGRAIAAVSHDHVVPIHAVDEHRGLPFIVMKYVSGLSLEQRIERDGPLDTRAAARVGLQVAHGLAAAHAQGVIHRDVKPANVMLEDTVERAMVTDFGLAQVQDEASMTRSGTISGTPQFMSPEQARGDVIDARSDLFSLGSLLYAACTGRAPFRAENVFGVIQRVCETRPRPVREVNPEIEAWLAALIDRLMAKRPEDRFTSAQEVAAVLEAELAYAQNPTGVAQPPRDWIPRTTAPAERGGSKRRAGLLLAAAAGLGGVVAFSLLAGGGSDGSKEMQAGLGLGLAQIQDGESDGALDGSWAAELDPSGAEPQTVLTRRTVQTLACSDIGRLQLKTDGVHLELMPGSSERIEVVTTQRVRVDDEGRAQVLADSFSTELDQVGDEVRFSAHLGAGTTESDLALIDVTHVLAIPADLTLNAEVHGGGLSVTDLAGNADVQVQGGDLRVHNPLGRVDGRTDGGDIHLLGGGEQGTDFLAVRGDIYVSGATGQTDLLTSGGDIHLAACPGTVKAQTSGGRILIDGLAGAVQAHASGADVVLQLREAPAERGYLASTVGDVRIELEEQVAVTLASQGNIVSSLEFAEQTGRTGHLFNVAEVNGGGEVIEIYTTTGALHVEQVSLPPSAGALVAHVDSLPAPAEAAIAKASNGSLAGGELASVGASDKLANAGKKGNAGSGSSPGKSSAGTGGSGPGGTGPSGLGGSGSGDSGPSGLGGSGSGGSGPSGLGGSGSGDSGPSSLGGSGSGGSGPSGLGGSGSGGTGPSGLGGSGSGGSGPSGLGGSGSGGSGPSGLGGSGSGGSGSGSIASLTPAAIAKTSGDPRPGALASVRLAEPTGNIDGYTLYLPVSHGEREEPWPVLLFLQGAYGVGGEIEELNNWGLSRLLRDEHDLSIERNRLLLDEFIVVSLHITEGQYHNTPAGVDAILDDVIAAYGGDASRVSVTGLSRGGHGSWGLAYHLPERFCAVAPVGGSSEDVLDFGRLTAPSIWIAHNEFDGVVNFSHATDAIEAIEAAANVEFLRTTPLDVGNSDYLERRHILTSSQAGGHDAWTDLYMSEEFYRWLLLQTRELADDEDGPF